MNKLIPWWGWGVYFFLSLSIILLGIGGFDFFPGGSVSAWSVSRTTFFFWLVWKLALWFDKGRSQELQSKRLFPAPLVFFFIFVTASLLPYFRNAGDYPYFLFACAHAVMLLDLFAENHKTRLLFLGLALLPMILVVRGLVHDPAVLKLSLSERLAYPLDHANTAGYVFSMSIPLALSVAAAEKGFLRGLGYFSGAIQMLGLLLTYSRGAWLGWATSMLFLAFALRKWTAGLLMILLPVALMLSITPLRERLATFMSPQADSALSDRVRVMTAAVAIGMENPVLGIGYGRGRLKEALRETFKGTIYEGWPVWHAHNVYAELFAETGLLGLGSFIILLGQAFMLSWRRTRSKDGKDRLNALGLAAAWIAAAVTGLGDVPFYHHSTRIFFFSLFALIQLQARADRSAGEGPAVEQNMLKREPARNPG